MLELIRVFKTQNRSSTRRETSARNQSTTPEVDERMMRAASDQVSSDYELVGASCIDVCTDALVAGGFNGGNDWFPVNRYEEIMEQNDGRDVTNLITPDIEVAGARKLGAEKIYTTKETISYDGFNNEYVHTEKIELGPSNRAVQVKKDFPQLWDNKTDNDYIHDIEKLIDIVNTLPKKSDTFWISDE